MTTPRHHYGCAEPDQVQTWTGQRGDLMATCNSCGYITPGIAAALQPGADVVRPEPETTKGRYRLDCILCGTAIRLDRPTPRVPLCRQCSARREADKVERRQSRAIRKRTR